MSLTMNSTIIELSVHACNFVLKVLDKEDPGARVWPKLMSTLQPKIAIFFKVQYISKVYVKKKQSENYFTVKQQPLKNTYHINSCKM